MPFTSCPSNSFCLNGSNLNQQRGRHGPCCQEVEWRRDIGNKSCYNPPSFPEPPNLFQTIGVG